jgi:hypothetical protein
MRWDFNSYINDNRNQLSKNNIEYFDINDLGKIKFTKSTKTGIREFYRGPYTFSLGVNAEEFGFNKMFDDLTVLGGLWDKTQKEFNLLGIYYLEQIVNLTEKDFNYINTIFPEIYSLNKKYDWVNQAESTMKRYDYKQPIKFSDRHKNYQNFIEYNYLKESNISRLKYLYAKFENNPFLFLPVLFALVIGVIVLITELFN